MADEHPLSDRQRFAMSNEASPYVEGMVFVATLQLRTPLWILKRDGEVRDPRDIDHNFEQWMGVWSVKPKGLDDLFAGFDEALEERSSAATPLGTLPRKQFLPFLIAVREVVERVHVEERKVAGVEALRANPLWADYIDRLGGADAVVGRT